MFFLLLVMDCLKLLFIFWGILPCTTFPIPTNFRSKKRENEKKFDRFNFYPWLMALHGTDCKCDMWRMKSHQCDVGIFVGGNPLDCSPGRNTSGPEPEPSLAGVECTHQSLPQPLPPGPAGSSAERGQQHNIND